MKQSHFRRNLTLIILLVILIIIVLLSYPIHKAFGKRTVECDDIKDVYIGEDMTFYAVNSAGSTIFSFDKNSKIGYYQEASNLSAANFTYTKGIAVDREKNYYVQNIISDEEAISWISRENIKVYNKSGLYKGTCMDEVFNVPQLNRTILDIVEIGGEVYAFKRSGTDLFLENVKTGDRRLYICPKMEAFVNKVKYDERADVVYALTRDGMVYRCSQKNFELIFNAADEYEDLTINDLFVYNDEIYLTDLWSNSLYKIQGNRLSKVTTFDARVYEFSNVRNNMVICNAVYTMYLLDIETMEFTEISEFSQNLVVLVWAFLFYAAGIAAFIVLSFLLIALVQFTVKRVGPKTKTMLGLSVVVTIMTLCFCCLVYVNVKSLLVDDMLDQEVKSARITSKLIDASDVEQLNKASDYRGTAYNKIKRVCDSVIFKESGIPGESYIMIYTLNDDEVVVRYSTEEVYGCNFPYVWSDGEDERSVYKNAKELIWNNVSGDGGSYVGAYFPILSEDGQVKGVLELGCDSAALDNKINSIMSSISISIFVLAIVFVLIFLEVFEFYECKRTLDADNVLSGNAYPPVKVYRVIVFLVFFVTNITTPFLSIYALKMAEGGSSGGVSPGLLAALPIAMEVVFGAIFSMTGGRILKAIGEHKSGILGGALFTVGLAIRFIYPSIAMLTIGNAIQGAGWGIVLLIVNTRIASEKDEEVQESGFADYNAAMQNGINSGVVTGGFLLLFFNYNHILFIAAVLSTILLLVCIKYIKDIKVVRNQDEETEASKISIMAFITSPRIILYYVLIVIPIVAASYYLNFLYPIIADGIGVNETIIGYSYLLNGLVVICFGNVIVNKMSKKFSKKVLLALASLIYAVVFAAIGIFTNVYALIFALIALAVSDSFGYVVQSTIYTEMKETELLGYDRAMGVYSLIENASQAIGSFLFGYILTVGVKGGMTVYGVVIGITGVLFAILFKPGRKLKEDE